MRLEEESLEGRAVSGHRPLVAGSTLDEVEHRAGEPSSGKAAEVVDRVSTGQAAHARGDDTIASREARMSGQRFGEVVELTWQGGLRFEARAGDVTVVLDSERRAGLSPVQALAVSLAGCMAMDVVDILQKGRFVPDGVQARLESKRRAEPPRYVTRVALHFVVSGDVPVDRVERAIELSRERYCSVWHSLRPDIDFRTSFEVVPTPPSDPPRAPGPQGDERHGVTDR